MNWHDFIKQDSKKKSYTNVSACVELLKSCGVHMERSGVHRYNSIFSMPWLPPKDKNVVQREGFIPTHTVDTIAESSESNSVTELPEPTRDFSHTAVFALGLVMAFSGVVVVTLSMIGSLSIAWELAGIAIGIPGAVIAMAFRQ